MQIHDARELAARHLAELGSRWAHVQAVGRLADSLAASGKVSRDVAMAAWLHDLGYAPALVRTRFHPLDGAVFLQEISAPANVVALVAHHTGAEYEATQRGLSQALATLPKPDPMDAESLLLLDLVIGPDGSPTTPSSRLREVLERYPTDDPVHRAVAASTSTLLAGAERARGRLNLPDEWPLSVAESMLKA
ncbi:HD domain-containing protein [Terrabacter sp. RAF57]|uniref:HD domain-containing protein n=1 Tax=Terrabacter sp. RAF57 TaxID=3233063 RepID=UPI003F997D5A